MLWAETLPQRVQVNADVVQRVQVNIAHVRAIPYMIVSNRA